MLKKDVNIKKLTIVCGCLVFLLLIVSVFYGKERKVPLSEQYDETVVMELAKQAENCFHSGDYQGLLDMMTTAYASENSLERLADEFDPILEECGAFVAYSDIELIGGTDPDTEEEYAGALIEAVYENKVLRFSIGFDQTLKMRQFLIL